MEPAAAADGLLAALASGRQEALLSPLKDRLAVVLRALAPSLYFVLMRWRARAGTGRPAS